jgi:membrane fusion protein, hemolysin D
MLMTIVPDSGGVEIDAQIANQDIGFVHEGMPVEVKLETFAFTRYGTVPATIRRIGRDAVKPPQQDNRPGTDLYYPARIALTRDTILVDGVERRIGAGMKVVAEIKTDQRRVIGFLLERVMGTVKQAGRER